MRTIKVCAGIGDNIWILMKLINTGEKFHFQLPNGKPQRGKQIFDLLPSVAASASYVPGLNYPTLAAGNIQKIQPQWEQIRAKEFFLSINEHLEQGKRIEEFFPDLPTTFKIDWATDEFKEPVQMRFQNFTKYIGIYCSSYSTARAWGFWDEHKWFDLISLCYQRDPEFVFVIIGAQWDIDVAQNLMNLLNLHGIPFINTIGKPLGYVVEVMKKLLYFFSFPSGLGILAPTVGCKVAMFYPGGKNGAPDYTNLMNAWADPKDIESGDYKGCVFCEPAQIFDWAVGNNKI